MPLFRRLRTQLMISHLIAIACTMIAMVLAIVLIAVSWWANQHQSLGVPAQEAQSVANAINLFIHQGRISPDLNIVLRGMAQGQLQVPN